MNKRVVLKRLRDSYYFSIADQSVPNIIPDCKYTFIPYDPFRIIKFDSEKEALTAYDEYCKHHCFEDIQIINIISE